MKRLWQDVKTANTFWLILWSVIYLAFLTFDLFLPNFIGSTILKLFGLLTCFVYAYRHYKNDYFLIIALAFTLLSDVILALNNTNPWGIFTFSIVQFFHMSRLIDSKDGRLLPAYLIGAGLIFLFGVIIGLPPIIVLGFIYAVTLLTNLFLSRRWYKKEPKSKPARHAFYGFLLFLACDSCVALTYFSSLGILPPIIFMIANYLVWFFYFPSQILICTSSKSVIK